MNISKDIKVALQDLFNRNKITFFCGAGISFNSGIPIVNAITSEILNTLLENETEAENLHAVLKSSKRPFEAFMQTVINLSGDDQLLDIFKLGTPNLNHFLIAYLCKSRVIKEVFTTNFDLLIEKAFQDIGLIEGMDYLVFASEKEFKNGLDLLKKHDNRIMLFKLHGSIHNKETIRTTLESIGRREWLIQRVKVIEYAFRFEANVMPIIEGYSFSDYFDINFVLSRLKKPKNVFYIEHYDEIDFGLLDDLNNKKINNNFSNPFEGYRISANTSQITELLWSLNNLPIKESKNFYIAAETNWKDEIHAWKNRLNPSIKEYIVAQLYFDLNKIEESLVWNKKASISASKHHLVKSKMNISYQAIALRHRKGTKKDILIAKNKSNELLKISYEIKNKATIASSINMQALILLHNEDNFLKAKEKYELSLPIFKDIQDRRGEAITLLGLGSCFRHLEDFTNAIELHKQSLMIRKELGDFHGMSRCYQGLGNIYLSQGKFRDAIKYYKLFRELTNLISDEWGVATANYKLAECYLHSSNRKRLNEALTLCDSSLDRRRLNINREYANCLFLRAQLNFKLNRIDQYIKDIESAWDIRKNNKKHKSDIADSLFEMGNMKLAQNEASQAFQNYMKALKIYINIGYNIQQEKVIKSIKKIINQLSSRQIISFNNLLLQQK